MISVGHLEFELFLLAIHEGRGVERQVDSIVNNIDSRDEQYDDGRHLSPQLLIGNEYRKCDDIDKKPHHPHCNADVARDVQSVSIYHSPLLSPHWPELSSQSNCYLFLSVNTNKAER